MSEPSVSVGIPTQVEVPNQIGIPTQVDLRYGIDTAKDPSDSGYAFSAKEGIPGPKDLGFGNEEGTDDPNEAKIGVPRQDDLGYGIDAAKEPNVCRWQSPAGGRKPVQLRPRRVSLLTLGSSADNDEGEDDSTLDYSACSFDNDDEMRPEISDSFVPDVDSSGPLSDSPNGNNASLGVSCHCFAGATYSQAGSAILTTKVQLEFGGFLGAPRHMSLNLRQRSFSSVLSGARSFAEREGTLEVAMGISRLSKRKGSLDLASKLFCLTLKPRACHHFLQTYHLPKQHHYGDAQHDKEEEQLMHSCRCSEQTMGIPCQVLPKNECRS